MTYLDPSEYGAYGLEKTVPAAWVSAASSLIEAYCRRPSLGIVQYTERVRLRPGRPAVQLSFLPLAAVEPAASPIIAARGRYTVPRRGEEAQGDFATEVALAFGLPGTWTDIDPLSIDYWAETGELTLPANPLGLGYNELEATYTAGFAQIPDAIKFACAQIVRNGQATPALNVRSGNLDQMHLEYFADTLVDSTVRLTLAPYIAQKLG